MIDIHCHILPGLDDGPQSNYLFINMAKEAVKSGITHIYATPHHLSRSYDNGKNKIVNLVQLANLRLNKENIPLKIHSGQEIRIHHDFFKSLSTGELLTFDNNGKYILLELPTDEVPRYIFELIYELYVHGITPIIAHPERNRELLKNPNLLFQMVDDGALTQITASSILGHFGRRIKSFTGLIIEQNLAHFIASDAHNIKTRGFFLREAYEQIRKIYGPSQTFFFIENAESLLNNKSVISINPLPIRKRKLKLF